MNLSNLFKEQETKTYNLADIVRSNSNNTDTFNAVAKAFTQEIRHQVLHSANRLFLRPTLRMQKTKTSFLYR